MELLIQEFMCAALAPSQFLVIFFNEGKSARGKMAMNEARERNPTVKIDISISLHRYLNHPK